MITPSPFLIGFEGTELDTVLSSHLKDMDPAGVILFQRNIISIQQTKQLIQQIRDLLGNTIIAVDHEGGIVSRFPKECPIPPCPAALARSGSLELVQKSCQIQAELLSYLGINLNFAPVLDLGIPDGTSILGPRVYSSDPNQVGTYGEICVKAHESVKVGTTAKHFPGHGNTTKDTHFEKGLVDKNEAFLWENDLKSFRFAIAAEVPAIMTAHLRYPALDRETPATLSKKILGDLLRKQMGFKGLIITDCVEMAGLSDLYSPENMVRKGTEAGVDLWISSFSIKKSVSFQKSLKKAWTELKENDHERQSLSTGRLNRFLEQYPLGTASIKSLPKLEETLEIHGKTICKVENGSPKFCPKGILLVELKEDNRGGINSGENINSLSDGIKKQSNHLKSEKVVYMGDRSALIQACESANQQNLLLVFITSNAYLQEGYDNFIAGLQRSDCCLHIALMEEQDHQGIAQYEWSTNGYCKLTGEVLGKEIEKTFMRNHLVQ